MESNLRKIFIISILVICIIAINLAVFFKITKKDNTTDVDEIVIDTAELTEKFNEIFDNKLNYQNNNPTVSKKDNTKEIIYESYVVKENIDGSYNLNVNIPYLNISGDIAERINKEINNLFYKKLEKILKGTDKYTIYSVKYKAYVNDNILSLIINTTLKEGDNPQRVIIKTYNYNLSSNSLLDIKQILEYREISGEYAQNRVNETIKSAIEKVNQYTQTGRIKYFRDINDKIYKLENTTVYFLGENKSLYVIYPYGNLDYTTEFDLLVM